MSDSRTDLMHARDQYAHAEYRRDLLPIDSDGWAAWNKTMLAWGREIRRLEKAVTL